jgi:CRP-like cAMP-binding protein
MLSPEIDRKLSGNGQLLFFKRSYPKSFCAMTPVVSATNRINGLLAALPPDDSRRISSLLVSRPLRARETLQRRGEALREVYFPDRSVCSSLITMDDGSVAEVAVVGSEGLIGVDAVFGRSLATSDVIVQVAGDGVARAMDVNAFRRELDQRGALYSIVTRYMNAFTAFLSQSVGCNGLHSADARCCRWLLHAQDRLGTTQLPLTHDMLATVLAVRRPTVTLAIADLVQAGIISTSRGVIRIVDRAQLEGHSCECYRTVKALFDDLSARDRPGERELTQTETSKAS